MNIDRQISQHIKPSIQQILPRLFFMGAMISFVLLLIAAPTLAKTRAVLVGVSDYYNLDDEFDLNGPRNDVREFSRYLLERGVKPADIVVLTGPGAGLDKQLSPVAPVRVNILHALDKVAVKSNKGDRVIFYFSGHGSLQPDKNGDEQGGSDEIFLPADVGQWNGGTGTVENAITDDELRTKMQAIRNKGATLFAIIDACHAATGFRGQKALDVDEEKSRFIEQNALGVPVGVKNNTGTPQNQQRRDQQENKNPKFAYFYATQADQRAYEHPIVKGAKTDQWYGDFTFSLLKVLRQSPNASYRQVMQAVKQRMRGRIGAKPQQPDFEGTILDSSVWNVEPGNSVRRFEIIDGELHAGILNDIGNNSVLALYAHADDGAAKILAHARTSNSQASRSKLIMIKYPCSGKAEECDLSDELPAAARFAEVVKRSGDLSVVFSTLIYPLVEPAMILPIDRAVNDLMDAPEGRFKFDQDNFDISLIVLAAGLIIGGPNGEYDTNGPDSSVRFKLPENKTWAEHLPDILASVARVHALYKMSEVVDDDFELLASIGGGLVSKLSYARASADERSQKKCRRKKLNQNSSSSAQMVELEETITRLTHCDKVLVTIENRTAKPQDVTILYVDASFGITPMWPTGGKSNRLAKGEKINVPLQIVTRTRGGKKLATGQERIVIFSVPVSGDTASRAVLTGLAQKGITLRGNASPAEKYLRNMLYPQQVFRDLFDEAASPPLNVKMHNILIVPPEQL